MKDYNYKSKMDVDTDDDSSDGDDKVMGIQVMMALVLSTQLELMSLT